MRKRSSPDHRSSFLAPCRWIAGWLLAACMDARRPRQDARLAAACPSPRISGAGPKRRAWRPPLGEPEIRKGGHPHRASRTLALLKCRHFLESIATILSRSDLSGLVGRIRHSMRSVRIANQEKGSPISWVPHRNQSLLLWPRWSRPPRQANPSLPSLFVPVHQVSCWCRGGHLIRRLRSSFESKSHRPTR